MRAAIKAAVVAHVTDARACLRTAAGRVENEYGVIRRQRDDDDDDDDDAEEDEEEEEDDDGRRQSRVPRERKEFTDFAVRNFHSAKTFRTRETHGPLLPLLPTSRIPAS